MTPRNKDRTGVALVLMLSLAAGACDSFLDVNENPNAAERAPARITLPAVLASFSTGVLGSWPSKMSAEWMQQLSYNRNERGFARYDRYEMRDVDADAVWELLYTGILNETVNIMRETSATEEWAYHAIAKVMHAWALAVATDLWGPIPLTEALDPANRRPRYDDQKTVYARIQELLDEAIEEFHRPNFPSRMPSANDLLYGGDLNRWIRLTWTLKAQAHLRVAYAPGEDRTSRAQLALDALQRGIVDNLDDADFRYPGGTNGRQPWHVARTVEAYRLSQHYVDLLQERNDPRLPITAERAAADIPATVYRGHRNGAPAESDALFSRVNNYFVLDTASFTLMSNANARFLEAEARLIVSGAAAADGAYRAGIRANMEKMRVAAAPIASYVNARPSLTGVADPLAEIMREKYVANFLKLEAWSDWRRTGHPALTPVDGAVIAGIPHRFPTPASEVASNGTNVQATGIPTGLQGMTTRVWWASQVP